MVTQSIGKFIRERGDADVSMEVLRGSGKSITCLRAGPSWLRNMLMRGEFVVMMTSSSSHRYLKDYAVDWATNANGRCGTCHFEENTDYGAGGSSSGTLASGFAYAPTPQQCCEACGASPLCAVAVWHKSPTNNHWTGKPEGVCILKSESDLAKKARRSKYTAMVPAARSRWKTVTINATVPGDLVTDL